MLVSVSAGEKRSIVQIIPRYETSSRRLERVRMKQRIVPTRQKMMVQAPWLVRVFIMMENVKT